MGVQHEASHAVCRPSADLTDRDLQLQLLQALLQGQPSPSSTLSGTPLNALPFSGMAQARVGVMTGTGPMTGLLLDDNPGPSLNRAQLLQALFKLEMEGQMPKVGHTGQKKKRKDYAFRRQVNEKPSIRLGCSGSPHCILWTGHGAVGAAKLMYARLSTCCCTWPSRCLPHHCSQLL